MEWAYLEWNSTIPEVLESLVDKWSEKSGQLSKFLFENCVLPVGQYLLTNAERAVQYTLNGEYEAVQEVTLTSLNQTLSWLDLSQFQIKLLREFSLIIIGNSVLVLFAWKVYGERIRNKFLSARQESTRKNIEELRSSLSELKLPPEMDFKYK